MRRKQIACVIYAVIAIGIGTMVACNDDAAAPTVPVRETPGAGILPEMRQPTSHPDGEAQGVEVQHSAAHAAQIPQGEAYGPEVQHHDSHRVWLEWATPGSTPHLCEGDSVPAAVLKRDDAQGNIYAMVYVSDPDHEGAAAHAETRHVGEHLPSGEDIDFAAGEVSVPLSYLGTIHDCVGCADVRDVTVGIASVHDRDDGHSHAETYGIGPVLTLAVHKSTHAACQELTTARVRGN